jgi:hypothetical protein
MVPQVKMVLLELLVKMVPQVKMVKMVLLVKMVVK